MSVQMLFGIGAYTVHLLVKVSFYLQTFLLGESRVYSPKRLSIDANAHTVILVDRSWEGMH